MGKTLFGSLATAGRSLVNKAPVPYVSGRSNIQIPWKQPTGAEAQMRAMGTVGTLFAIVNRTSNAAAQVEWKLYRKAASGKKEDRTEVPSHAALDLINRPNPFFTRQELIETVQQHIDLTGEGWLVVARNPRSKIPLELWPVRPDRMQPVPHPTDFISGYMYTAPDGQQIALRTEDVIFIRMPNPLDLYRGMGPVQSILTEIDASRYSAEWNRNFFLNSAEPGGIIEVPDGLSDPEFDQLRERWNEQHKGVANAHRVAILEHGKWVDRKYTQRDMQFAELRSISRDVMREAFGAPAFVLGEVGDVNRATADASKALFAEQLTVPRLERFKGAFNNDLLALYGPDAARMLEFDYEDPVPPDAEARNAEMREKTSAYVRLVNAGADPKLVSEYLGLPEISGDADRGLLKEIVKGAPSTAPLILPLLGFDVPQQPAPTPSAGPAAPAAARVDLHHHVPFLPTRQPSYNLVGTDRPRRPLLAKVDHDEALAQVREQFEDALTALLEAWEPIADAQYEALAEQVETAVDAGDTEALAALTVDSVAGALALRQALADLAEQAAVQMAAEAAEQGVKVRPPRLDKALTNAFGSELVEVAVVTAGLLAADVAASAGREALRLLTPGVAGREIAAQVTGFLKGLKNWFRRDQLGGALHRAQNTGRVATLQAAPKARYFASEKNDANRCGPCGEIDGTEFDDLDAVRAAYGTGGYLRCEGGIRCRGTVTAVWETTEEASMGRTCWNTASPEQIAARGRAMRPALAAPGTDEGWYRITNTVDEGGSPTASVHIYGDIGSWGITAASFVEELKAVDAAEIHLFVNSPGGEVFDGLAIHNALRSHRARVMVQVDSLAASIASVIAMAGDRIVMSPHSQMMIHDAQGVSCGNPEELREYADFLDRQSDNIAAVYAERAGGTKAQWRKRMQAETWYFADEAVEAGLADEVCKPKRMDPDEDAPGMDDRAIAAAWDLSVYNYAHTSREQAPAPELPVDKACPKHDTATVDSPWDAGPNERRLPSPMTVATAKKAYGWYDPAQVENGELPKTACKFPHHEVDGDGTPGAANLAACRNGLARLPQSDVPEAERAAVEAHLRAHLAAGGSEDHTHGAPPTAVFDGTAFTNAVAAGLDPGPMPGFEADRFRDLMGSVATTAPAPPPAATPTAPLPSPPSVVEEPVEPGQDVEPPAAVMPGFDPNVFRTAARAAFDLMPDYEPDHFRGLMAGMAADAPAHPNATGPEPTPPPVVADAVPVDQAPQQPANEVAVDYFRTLLANAAQDLAAPEQAAAPGPAPVEPIPSIDRNDFVRSLREARL